MPYDPYPMLEKIQRIIPSKQSLGVDLEDPRVWSHAAITEPDFYLTVHWGGGPNEAGKPVEEPKLTRAQKIAIVLGRVFRVLRSWMAYHISKGQSTIAYSTWVDSLFGRIGKLRGHRWNGGQWGAINGITHAVVLVMGLGQKASKKAWESIGLMWFCAGGPRVVGHRFFNDWKETLTTTSCPGDENDAIIKAEGYVDALGILHLTSRGRRVRAVTLKLTKLGFLDGMYGIYRPKVKAAVRQFQTSTTGLTADGLCGPKTWKVLATTEKVATIIVPSEPILPLVPVPAKISLPGRLAWGPKVERWRSLIAIMFDEACRKAQGRPATEYEIDLGVGIVHGESSGDHLARCHTEWIGEPPPGYNPDDPTTRATGLCAHVPAYYPSRARAAGFTGEDILDPVAQIGTMAWMVYDYWDRRGAPHWHHWTGAHVNKDGSLEKAQKALAPYYKET